MFKKVNKRSVKIDFNDDEDISQVSQLSNKSINLIDYDEGQDIEPVVSKKIKCIIPNLNKSAKPI